jgi:hypothetical protein
MENEQLKLVDDKDVFQKDRPKIATDKQMNKIFDGVAKEIIQWQLSKDSKDVIVKDLKSVYDGYTSAFTMAKELGSNYNCSGAYQLNSTFVELLESVESEVSSAIIENVKAWVKAHSIELKLKKGESFKLDSELNGSLKKGDTFHVIYLKEDTAEYVVNKNYLATGGYVIKAEILEKSI